MRIAVQSSQDPSTHKPNHRDYLHQDLRKTTLWSEVDDYLNNIFTPKIDQVSAAADLAASPDGKQIAFTGTINSSNWRDSPPKKRICILSTSSSSRQLEVISAGPNTDHLPKWSPDGKTLAFLSDRNETGILQLNLLDTQRIGEAKSVSTPGEGAVEDFHWAPDGKRILLLVAGREAEKGDADGSGRIGKGKKDKVPEWMPSVDYGDLSEAWRTLWAYDLDTRESKRVSSPGCNPWEAAWCGSNAVVSIASDSPSEDVWYGATLRIKNLDEGEDGKEKVVYVPKRQLAFPTASPSGEKIAVIEGLASDRQLVAGDIVVVNTRSETKTRIPDLGVDVTHITWRNEDVLSYIGLRGLHTVASQYPASSHIPEWEHHGAIAGGLYPVATLLPGNDIAIVKESWTQPPEITIISRKKESVETRTLLSFSHSGYESLHKDLGPMKTITWHAEDGLELQGLLHLPKSTKGKAPLITSVHGGPVYANLNTSAGVGLTTFLNLKGYAVFCPNPRGSSGRGRAFAEAVLGDMGGADAQDILSGIKSVCDTHADTIDADKIGVIGGSYGGFMASLLPTLSPIFKASVSMSAVTDWHSFHMTTNIPTFDRFFLDDDPFSRKGGRYLDRSPVMDAGKYKTPVLQTAGAQDLAVPQSQAVQYHRACLERGVESVMVLYPGEGHGVRTFPALMDLLVRSAAWFERFMPVEG
ncbi:Alpha/Beta hydrolase protein [Xylogone sp. PMI_703]|nr:Alpha/Beta hydrolase protein [Xylogone sp. PMI_703]